MRLNGLAANVVGGLMCLALSHVCAFAQTQTKEPSPFDWLRPDAPPVNRPSTPMLNSPVQSVVEDRAPPLVEPSGQAVSPTMPQTPVALAPASPPPSVLPSGSPKPSKIAPSPATSPAAQHRKAKPVFDRLDVTNNRVGILNELKFVSIKPDGKSFVLKPGLKGGQSVQVEVPKYLGCIFVVWVQVGDDPSEQHEGIDLCDDKKVFLIN